MCLSRKDCLSKSNFDCIYGWCQCSGQFVWNNNYECILQFPTTTTATTTTATTTTATTTTATTPTPTTPSPTTTTTTTTFTTG